MEALSGAVRRSWESAGRPARVLAALSGGADSVALLLLLRRLQSEGLLNLTASHVNHGLRANADGDEAFARELCRQWDVPFLSRRVVISGDTGIEDAARSARYAALRDMKRESGAEVIALAHHLRDQSETVLMHLARGSGADGLCGMYELQGDLWRPLLNVPPERLRALCGDIPWREDESNRDTRYARNALRLRVLPELRRVYPGADEAMRRASLVMQDEKSYFRGIAREYLWQNACTRPPCPFLNVGALRQAHVAVQRRVLRAFWEAFFAPLSLDETERLRLCMQSMRAVVNLPGGVRAQTTGERLHLLLPCASGGFAVRCALAPFAGDRGDGVRAQAMPLQVYQSAAFRTARADDVITPFAKTGAMPLRQYLSEKKIDPPFRAFYPVLARGSEVVWAPGAGASRLCRVTENAQNAVLARVTSRLPGDTDNIQEEQQP